MVRNMGNESKKITSKLVLKRTIQIVVCSYLAYCAMMGAYDIYSSYKKNDTNSCESEAILDLAKQVANKQIAKDLDFLRSSGTDIGDITVSEIIPFKGQEGSIERKCIGLAKLSNGKDLEFIYTIKHTEDKVYVNGEFAD